MEKLSYYILTPSTDAKLIGNYPQIIDFVTEENISSNISVEEFANYKGKFCEFNPNLNTFILHGQSKFTNMYSCSLCPGGDLLIDNDFNEILKKAKKGPVQIFNSKLKKRKQTDSLNTFVIHFLYDLEGKINFQLSEFSTDIYSKNDCECIKSFEDLMEFRETIDNHYFLKANKLVMSKEFDLSLDLFVLSWMDQNVYVSEKLKREIQSHKFIGIEFNEAYLYIE